MGLPPAKTFSIFKMRLLPLLHLRDILCFNLNTAISYFYQCHHRAFVGSFCVGHFNDFLLGRSHDIVTISSGDIITPEAGTHLLRGHFRRKSNML